MVTALGLYCDLLEEPGVLATPYAHYGNELRLVAAASRRLVEKLVELDAHPAKKTALPGLFAVSSGRPAVANAGLEQIADRSLDRGLNRNPSPAPASSPGHDAGIGLDRNRRWDLLPAVPVENLAAELLANRNLLSALAGPSIALTVDAEAVRGRCGSPART